VAALAHHPAYVGVSADNHLPADIALARGDFAAMGRVLEEHMNGRGFLVGNSVTVADFVLAYTLDWAMMFKLLDGLPRLDQYMQQMYALPSAPPRINDIVAGIRRAWS
jgi:glutathione S-transferase